MQSGPGIRVYREAVASSLTGWHLQYHSAYRFLMDLVVSFFSRVWEHNTFTVWNLYEYHNSKADLRCLVAVMFTGLDGFCENSMKTTTISVHRYYFHASSLEHLPCLLCAVPEPRASLQRWNWNSTPCVARGPTQLPATSPVLKTDELKCCFLQSAWGLHTSLLIKQWLHKLL